MLKINPGKIRVSIHQTNPLNVMIDCIETIVPYFSIYIKLQAPPSTGLYGNYSPPITSPAYIRLHPRCLASFYSPAIGNFAH